MKISESHIAELTGNDRRTISRRVRGLGLIATPGPKNARLIESEDILQLRDESHRGSLEEARTEDALASARLKRLQAEKLEGNLADVAEILEWQNDIFDRVIAIVKKSTMSDHDKEDCLGAIAGAAREWETEKMGLGWRGNGVP